MDPFEAIAAAASLIIILLALDTAVCIAFCIVFFVRSTLWLIKHWRL